MFKRISIIILSILIIGLLSYFNAFYINTNQIQVRQEKLQSTKIDEDLDGFLIAYFSDLYYGSNLDKNYLDKVFSKINSFKPDLIIFGGDLIDYDKYISLNQEDKDYLSNNLSNLNSKYGKYAILGEYDYKNIDNIYSIYALSDFTILNNTNHVIGVDRNSYINIVGIDSLVDGNPDLTNSFSGVNYNAYTIVLSHCPDIFDEINIYDYDYLLSGHSRGGQIYFPIINLFTRPIGAEKYFSGKITRNGKTLDISNGIGTINTHARINADSEIVLYSLQSIKLPNTSE